jgi:hypothetical protein
MRPRLQPELKGRTLSEAMRTSAATVLIVRGTTVTWSLVVRHRDRPGVLAHVLEHLRARRLNVQEMDNEERTPIRRVDEDL